MEKLCKEAFHDEISVRETRLILTHKFRMGKVNVNSVLIEMVKLGLIDYKDHGTLIILWKPED